MRSARAAKRPLWLAPVWCSTRSTRSPTSWAGTCVRSRPRLSPRRCVRNPSCTPSDIAGAVGSKLQLSSDGGMAWTLEGDPASTHGTPASKRGQVGNWPSLAVEGGLSIERRRSLWRRFSRMLGRSTARRSSGRKEAGAHPKGAPSRPARDPHIRRRGDNEHSAYGGGRPDRQPRHGDD